ncbi:Tripartite motif-containing protein 59 [Holothuria leucospilota]|uniref:Tripartite motif-containing protein 59 n=1 Tax=Holothuria leucospilota TaxID=206669 RepID=A0A9Q1HLM3_HOLLE|nr:Tripartite motif-containing protein 59 [Holothuria leucospilota]
MSMGGKYSTSNFLVGPDNFTCTICHQKFENPKTLHCGHTFCLPCLQRLRRMSTVKGHLKCPMCRQEAELPLSGKVEDFPTNFALQRILQGAIIQQERRRHKRIKIEESLECSRSKVNCVYHNNLACDSFCVSCNALVCVTCTITSHRSDSGHEVTNLTDQLQVEQQTVSEMINKLDKMYVDTVKIVGLGYLLNYNYTNQMESIVSFKSKAEVFLTNLEEARQLCEDLRNGLLSSDQRTLLEVREARAHFTNVLGKYEELTRLCLVIVDELLQYFQDRRNKILELQSLTRNSLVVFYLTGDKPPLVKGSPYRLLVQIHEVLVEHDIFIEGFQKGNYQVITKTARMEKLWSDVCENKNDLKVHLRNIVASHVIRLKQNMSSKMKLKSFYHLKFDRLESFAGIFQSNEIVSHFEEVLNQARNSLSYGLIQCDKILKNLDGKNPSEMKEIISKLSNWEVHTTLLYSKVQEERMHVRQKRYLMFKIIGWTILGILFIDWLFRLKEVI